VKARIRSLRLASTMLGSCGVMRPRPRYLITNSWHFASN